MTCHCTLPCPGLSRRHPMAAAAETACTKGDVRTVNDMSIYQPLKKNICLYDGWIMLNNNLRIVQKFHSWLFQQEPMFNSRFWRVAIQKKVRCWVFYGFPDSLVVKILIRRFKQHWVDRMHNMCYHCPAWNGHKLGVNPLYFFEIVTFQPNALPSGYLT